MPDKDPIPLAPKAQIDPDPSPLVGSEAPHPEPPEFVEQPAEITVEEPAHVIDIHPPQHGAITRRDFFVHLFIVILGILIAIGLEQTVEGIHHAYERRALIEDFHRECADNLTVFEFDLGSVRDDIAWERSALAVLRSAKPQDGDITVTMPRAQGGVIREPSRAVWSIAKSSGKVELLPENLAEVFDRVDNEGARFDALVQTFIDARQRVRSFRDRGGSSLDTGETIHLTLAQRDDAISLIDSLLVQDELYRSWLSNWQGASQSVLGGVQTREAMVDYIRHANLASANNSAP